MMVQKLQIFGYNTPTRPSQFSNVGRVKGVSLLVQNFTYFNKSKPASHKCRTVKYVLTRSSEFQENNRRKISREQKFQERRIKIRIHGRSFQTN
jgi:hypothetical protein